MLVKRIFLHSKRLRYYICTSAVRSCDKPRKGSLVIDSLTKDEDGEDKRRQGRKTLEYPEKIVSPEEKENAKYALNALLENLNVEIEKKEEDKVTDVGDMVKVQFNKKEARKEYKKNFGTLLFDAAESVAKDLGGDTKKTKEDLLERLRTIEVTQEPEVHAQFPVEKTEPGADTGSTLRSLAEVFSEKRLNIFGGRSAEAVETEVKLKIWEKLEEEELVQLARKPPRNQLEEWILWTEQGKLWQFPIDNDQGMEREAEVEFTQHVFLEEHLEPWCPKKGPLKKFMDLVLVGLSKNPYLTVEDKKEHIFWYRDYFEKKKKLLQELGAFGSTKEIGDSSNQLPEEKL